MFYVLCSMFYVLCSMFYVQCSRCCLLLILLNGVFMSRWNFDVVLKQCCYCVSISATDFTCLFLVLDSALFVRQLIPFVCVCVCVCVCKSGRLISILGKQSANKLLHQVLLWYEHHVYANVAPKLSCRELTKVLNVWETWSLGRLALNLKLQFRFPWKSIV